MKMAQFVPGSLAIVLTLYIFSCEKSPVAVENSAGMSDANEVRGTVPPNEPITKAKKCDGEHTCPPGYACDNGYCKKQVVRCNCSAHPILPKCVAACASDTAVTTPKDSIPQSQKCDAQHHCPPGYTCHNGSCIRNPIGCSCATRGPSCAPLCGFLAEPVKNRVTKLVTIVRAPEWRLIHVHFQLEGATTVRMRIYDAWGAQIKTFSDETLQRGFHEIEWNKKDEDNDAVGPGTYILIIDTGDNAAVKNVSVNQY